MASPETPLRAVDLDLGYRGEQVVHGAALELTAGRVTALVGPNGSGKSTLLRAMARLHAPDAGDVLLADDSSALALSPRDFARQVTLLVQSRPTPTGVRVREVTATAVAAVGVIAFVGLVAPHAARALVGGRHVRVLPLAALLGASLVCLADTIGRTIIAPDQLPAGLMTALIGAPYFVWLLWRTLV